MNTKEINRVFLAVGAFALIAVVSLLFLWNYLFTPRDKGDQSDLGIKFARIVNSTGEVLSRKAASVEWRSVKKGDFLGERDKLKTMNSSTAAIEFENGSLINVKPNSLIVLESLYTDNTRVELVGGKLNAQIEKISQGEVFLIRVGDTKAEVFREEIRVD